MVAEKVPFYTPEEYLERERKAAFRSEYINGQIYTMAGASEKHNTVTLNIASEFRFQMRGRPCRTYVNDMRVHNSTTGRYTYPGVVAVCGERKFEDAELDTLLNPTVLVEVLSPSTEADDRGSKFAHARRIPSLRDYVLVAQSEMRVEHFTRAGENWILTELNGSTSVLELPSIGCAIALQEIYENVVFAAPDETAPNTAAE